MLALVLVLATALPATAQEPGDDGGSGLAGQPYVGDSVFVMPHDGAVVRFNGRRYAGDFEIKAGEGGLVVVEHVSIDDYLLGIQEVPFSWETEALKAQAVAARTYLAWTLDRGRAGAAATYGFDICATDQCQVYGGLGQVEGADGARWADAVLSTADEILLANGSPAQALYSSTAGPRTRNVEDVFGTSPLPYLRAVESPGETSPYVSWRIEIPAVVFAAVLRDADLLHGALQEVTVTRTEDGGGSWMVNVISTNGIERLSTLRFRSRMNASGPRVRPDVFPGLRPDGRRYPNTILSPTFDISREWVIGRDFTTGYVPATAVYTIEGSGWGHQVGMSQYGAQAMASAGAGYADILTHYYTGLQPAPAPSVLPDLVQVGLGWGLDEVTISADGPYDIVADGVVLAEGVVGSWTVQRSGRDVLVAAPEGVGFPPVISGIDPVTVHRAGFAVQLIGEVSSGAETRYAVFKGTELLHVSEWAVTEAGRVVFLWNGNVHGSAAPPGSYQFILYARSGDGRDVEVVEAILQP